MKEFNVLLNIRVPVEQVAKLKELADKSKLSVQQTAAALLYMSLKTLGHKAPEPKTVEEIKNV